MRGFWLGLLCWTAGSVQAVDAVYTPEDSVAVERLLREVPPSVPDSSRVLFFAEALCGVPYVANTLERDGKEEALVICMSGFDCMTFVETVLALAEAHREGKHSFGDFARCLRQIRYRDGVVDGYCSRLHYFTEWAEQNLASHAGWQEVTACLGVSCDCSSRELDFMSSHASLYPHLQDDEVRLRAIKEVEKRISSLDVCRIRKEDAGAALGKVPAGCLVAFTTRTEGLDVSHVGFVVKKEGNACLLHASSRHKKVLVEPASMDDYLSGQPSVSGIRVFRFY